MIRRLAVLATALLGFAGLTACGIAGRLSDGHLDIEQAELQARIAPRFPTQNCKLIVACIDLSNPLVVLNEGDDRLALLMDARVSLGSRDRTGRVGFSARPRYAPAEGQLFLEDVQISTLEFAGLADEYAALLKLRGPALIKGLLQARPVYTIDTGTAKGTLAKMVVQDVKVVHGKLRISFVPAGNP